MATASLPSYGGAFGSAPQPIAMPQNQYQQTAGVVPGLPSLTGSAANVIGSELQGKLSPGTQSYLQDQAAVYGVNAGMPWNTSGNSLSLQNLLENVGLSSEELSQKGVQQYNQFLPTVGGQQTNPALAADVSEWNSQMLAAPNPSAAAGAELQQFQQNKDPWFNLFGHTGGQLNQDPALLAPGTTGNTVSGFHTPAVW